ncbi:MAG: DUF1934 family protein [Anaerorhabdus sp.]
MNKKENMIGVIRQIDYLSKQHSILYQGNLTKMEQSFTFETDDQVINVIQFLKTGVQIDRNGDMKTTIILPYNQLGVATAVHKFGQLQFTSKLLQSHYADGRWEIEYQLLQQQEVVSHMYLRCEW